VTQNELITRFPKASRGFLDANLSSDHPRSVAKLEPDSRDAALGAEKVQGSTGERFLVRVASIRKRLLDEDNL